MSAELGFAMIGAIVMLLILVGGAMLINLLVALTWGWRSKAFKIISVPIILTWVIIVWLIVQVVSHMF